MTMLQNIKKLGSMLSEVAWIVWFFSQRGKIICKA